MYHIATRLTDLRQQFGYSREDLADILQVPDAMVYEWERGESVPGDRELARLSSLYQVPVESILTNMYIPAEEPQPARKRGQRGEELGKRLGEGFPIVVVLAYLALGFLFRLWHPGWLIFLAIPIFYTTFYEREEGQGLLNDANFPIIVATLYLIAGFFFHRWHPTWVIFLTIPLYYTVGRNKE